MHTSLTSPPTVDELRPHLTNPDPMARVLAVRALGHTGDARAVGLLLPLLQQPSERLSHAAIEALGVLKDPCAVVPLLWLALYAPRRLTRVRRESKAAVLALGAIGDRRAVVPLLAFLDQENLDRDVRRAIYTTLGRLGDSRAVEPMLVHLFNASEQDAVHIVWAFGMIGSPRAGAAVRSHLRFARSIKLRTAAAVALGKMRCRSAVNALITALRDPSPDVRRNAALALGHIGDGCAVEPILAALREDRACAHACVEALGLLGDRRAVAPVVAHLQDETVFGRAVAAAALGRLGDARAVEPLRALLTRDTLSDQAAARRSLAALGVVVSEG